MTYRERERLRDILAAVEAIRSHVTRGDLQDCLVFDAVRIRLLEIGEAVKALPDELLASEPEIPWRQVARMRDHLAHRYFDTSHGIVQGTVENDLRNSKPPFAGCRPGWPSVLSSELREERPATDWVRGRSP